MSAADILLALSELDLRERLIFRLAVFGGLRVGGGLLGYHFRAPISGRPRIVDGGTGAH
jgi:hypothetical protein